LKNVNLVKSEIPSRQKVKAIFKINCVT
jgi:hypothetical protein